MRSFGPMAPRLLTMSNVPLVARAMDVHSHVMPGTMAAGPPGPSDPAWSSAFTTSARFSEPPHAAGPGSVET